MLIYAAIMKVLVHTVITGEVRGGDGRDGRGDFSGSRRRMGGINGLLDRAFQGLSNGGRQAGGAQTSAASHRSNG